RLPDVAILAGGRAKRLRPMTHRMPKALVEVIGEPFIAHQLRLLRERGVERAVICTGHLGGMIQEFVGNGARFGLAVEFSRDGRPLLGTAGAVKKALPLLSETFFVLYGDSYLDCDYRGIQARFERSGKAALMTIYRNEGRWDTSNVEYTGGRLLAYDKKHPTPRMRYIDYGLGLFQRRAFDGVPPGKPYDLAHLYRDLLRLGEVVAYEVSQRFYEIGSFEGLEEIRRHLAARTRTGAAKA
ncbi:MAG: nucleotidyltransferase family protein, partial [Planctomycetota bacterium]|nr:nucleotidyltransferase family protein [Planctomycetota bacterium]